MREPSAAAAYAALDAEKAPCQRGIIASESGEQTDHVRFDLVTHGVDIVRTELPADLADRLEAIRRVSPLPVAAGFGISTKEQADAVSRHADGYIVGSALVKRLGEEGELKGAMLR